MDRKNINLRVGVVECNRCGYKLVWHSFPLANPTECDRCKSKDITIRPAIPKQDYILLEPNRQKTL